MKTCLKCGDERHESNFGKCSYKGRVYLRNVCNGCRQASRDKDKVKTQNHKSYLKHREKRLAETKEYALKHPEVKQQAREKWKKENPDLHRAAQKKWKENNPEKVREKSKRNCKAARDRLDDWVVRKDLLKRGFSPEDITPDLMKAQRAMILAKRTIKEIA